MFTLARLLPARSGISRALSRVRPNKSSPAVDIIESNQPGRPAAAAQLDLTTQDIVQKGAIESFEKWKKESQRMKPGEYEEVGEFYFLVGKAAMDSCVTQELHCLYIYKLSKYRTIDGTGVRQPCNHPASHH